MHAQVIIRSNTKKDLRTRNPPFNQEIKPLLSAWTSEDVVVLAKREGNPSPTLSISN
jgi:hypothetical protein